MKKFIQVLLLFFVFIVELFPITIVKSLEYDKYTLPETYKYKKGIREFQFEKIAEKLQNLDNFEKEKIESKKNFGILRNYKNSRGYKARPVDLVVDNHGIERDRYGNFKYQGVPLYSSLDSKNPERYALDGELVIILDVQPNRIKVKFSELPGEWYVPLNYITPLSVNEFRKVVVIDKKNQNVVTLDEVDSIWKIRSMNPITTGVERPPHSFDTPLGTFIFQDKLNSMPYLKEGSKTEIEGYAPYASRFSGGAYIHGIPVNLPKTGTIEYAEYLGTYPKSHKCIRSATSHAKFLYTWGPPHRTIVFVIE